MRIPSRGAAGIGAAFFDVGETLVSERRVWERWADRLGVEHDIFFAALGATIEGRRHHREVFALVAPGVDVARHERARRHAGERPDYELYDVYPDALPCLERLRSAGVAVGVAGNQPEGVEGWLRARLGPDVLLASSASWRAEKPSAEFFGGIVALAGMAPERVAYVGDRVDNDVVPAAAGGMRTVLVRRGPWGVIQSTWPEARRADRRVSGLDEAAAALLGFGA